MRFLTLELFFAAITCYKRPEDWYKNDFVPDYVYFPMFDGSNETEKVGWDIYLQDQLTNDCDAKATTYYHYQIVSLLTDIEYFLLDTDFQSVCKVNLIFNDSLNQFFSLPIFFVVENARKRYSCANSKCSTSKNRGFGWFDYQPLNK